MSLTWSSQLPSMLLMIFVVSTRCHNSLTPLPTFLSLFSIYFSPFSLSDEALEAVAVNPWLNYSLPLHRIREMGCNNRVLDFLDERPLSKREQKEVCSLLFGKDKMISCPDPCIDWPGFLSHIDRVQTNGKRQWVSSTYLRQRRLSHNTHLTLTQESAKKSPGSHSRGVKADGGLSKRIVKTSERPSFEA